MAATDAGARLGELLVKRGCLSVEDLAAALHQHRRRGVPLGRVLLEDRLCSEGDVVLALATQARLAPVTLGHMAVKPQAEPLLPERLARYHRMVPLGQSEGRHRRLQIAVAAPVTSALLEDLRELPGRPEVELKVASDTDIAGRLAALYGPTNTAALPSVLLFGWQPAMMAHLQEALQQQGMKGKPAKPNDVLSSKASDVVVAPLWSLPELLPMGKRLAAHLIVQAEGSDADLDYARSIGARGFLPAAFDGEWLTRTLRRFLALENS